MCGRNEVKGRCLVVPETAKALKELKLDLQFIRRRADELQSDFEAWDDINLAVISAFHPLAKIELSVQTAGGEAVAA
jgi:hypothetical protein